MVNRGRKVFTIILIIILIIGLSLGGYLIYTYVSDYFVKKEAEEAVDEFENIIAIAMDEEKNNSNPEEIQEEQYDDTPTERTYRRVTYKSFNVVGTIQIPRIGIKYPIVDDPSPSAMESAIVFLYGPGLNQIGNNVIVGHNYRGGSFFGSNKKLVEGDLIYITDLSGREIEYEIYSKYETTDDDFSYATRNTNGKREISLSTCTNNASVRLVIWAVET